MKRNQTAEKGNHRGNGFDRFAPVKHPIPVLLLTSQVLLSELLCQHLARTRKFKIIGIANDGKDAVKQCQALAPAILAVDTLLASRDLPATLRAVREKSPRTRVLQFNAAITHGAIQRALQQGIAGYVGWDAPVAELVRTLEAVQMGRVALACSVARLHAAKTGSTNGAACARESRRK